MGSIPYISVTLTRHKHVKLRVARLHALFKPALTRAWQVSPQPRPRVDLTVPAPLHDAQPQPFSKAYLPSDEL